MCGIFAYIGKNDNAADLVFDGLQRLEYRGYDSWGIALAQGDELNVHKQVGKIVDRPQLPKATIAIGHDRWATHGGVTETNAHPHTDCSKKIAVVHNGIVENFQALKQELVGEGHQFASETDTEVIPHLIEENLKVGASFVDAVKDAMSRLDGRNAIVAYVIPGKTIIGIRNGSPLVFGVGKDEYFLASDIPAFLPYTNKVIFLNDGEGVVVNHDSYHVISLADKDVPIKIETIDWSTEQAQKGEFPHFLLKEIMEEPNALLQSAEQDLAQVTAFAKLITEAFGSYLVACGTASYAALYGTYIFSEVAKKHINWAIGSEFPDYQHFLTPKSFVITVSQSGETTDTVMAAEIAKKHGANVAAIVNVMGSTLMRIADYPFLTNAGPEIAVASTKAFISQLSVLTLLAYAAANKIDDGKHVLQNAADAIAAKLTPDYLGQIKAVAEKIKDREHMFAIGKGKLYPIALETALKIKEVSYMHVEGLPAGELKHGAIALIEPGLPCIVHFGGDEDAAYVIGSAMEIKARGGYLIGVGPKNNDVFDEFISVPAVQEAQAIVNTPPVHLLAYFLALLRGKDPDKPRNLAKSVTVK